MKKLVIVIANRDIEKPIAKELIKNKFRFTRIGSTGGFLKKKNITLLIGVESDRVENLIKIIKNVAHERASLIGSDSGAPLSSEAGMPDMPLGAAPLRIGGATIFVLPVEQALHF